MRKLRVLDLFSGIGGFSLGLERAGGFETVAFCEIEPYPRAVLAKHWPHVPCYDDVRTLTADALRRDGIAVDVICGGFPCQDLSFAGKRAGLEGARSGLWGQYARLIGELRPRFVIVENVPGLLSLGMGTVLGDLASLGYDATWDCIPAAAVGAPHRRDRVWLVAYAKHDGWDGSEVSGGIRTRTQSRRVQQSEGLRDPSAPHPDRQSQHARPLDAEVGRASQLDPDASPLHRPSLIGSEPHGDHAGAGDMADATSHGRQPRRTGHSAEVARGRQSDRGAVGSPIRNSDRQRLAVGEGQPRDDGQELAPTLRAGWWLIEPDVGRVAHGVPSRVDRLRGLGNAVVPQIPELIGRAIMQAEGMTP